MTSCGGSLKDIANSTCPIWIGKNCVDGWAEVADEVFAEHERMVPP